MNWVRIGDELVDSEGIVSIKPGIDEDTVEIRYHHGKTRTLKGVTTSEVVMKIGEHKSKQRPADNT